MIMSSLQLPVLHSYDTLHPQSRKSFATTTGGLQPSSASTYRLQKWSEQFQTTNKAIPDLTESLSTGTNLERSQWVTLNRAKLELVKQKENLKYGDLSPAQPAIVARSTPRTTYYNIVP